MVGDAALREHRLQVRRARRRQLPLRHAAVGVPERAHVPGRAGQLGTPLDGVVAVLDARVLRIAALVQVVRALGVVATANVLVDDDGSGSISVTNVAGNFTVSDDGSGSISHSGVEGSVNVPAKKERRRRRGN